MRDMNREDEIIGANIKIFREAYGITREKLAGIFHVSDDGMYRIERGETGLSSSYAYILANELHCDMNFIYGLTVEPALVDVKGTDISPISPESIASRLRIYADMLDKLAEENN